MAKPQAIPTRWNEEHNPGQAYTTKTAAQNSWFVQCNCFGRIVLGFLVADPIINVTRILGDESSPFKARQHSITCSLLLLGVLLIGSSRHGDDQNQCLCAFFNRWRFTMIIGTRIFLALFLNF